VRLPSRPPRWHALRSRSRDDGPASDHLSICKRGLVQGHAALRMARACPRCTMPPSSISGCSCGSVELGVGLQGGGFGEGQLPEVPTTYMMEEGEGGRYQAREEKERCCSCGRCSETSEGRQGVAERRRKRQSGSSSRCHQNRSARWHSGLMREASWSRARSGCCSSG
jgi:hypothetical protein